MLLKAGMQQCSTYTHLEKVPEEVVTVVLCVHKDDNLARLIPLAQNLQEPQETIILWPNFHKLCDVCVDHTTAANLQQQYRGKVVLPQASGHQQDHNS